MRKSLFITVVLSLCMAEFGAFSAPARRPGGANSARAAQTTNVVNPGVGQKGASAPTVNVQQNNGGAVRGRRGATQNANTNGKATTQNVGGNGKAPAAISARAAATKKAISMGTKVAAATENTVISQECQNAYYGCMDAFCMLDNASGGRCQCNDKITELDTILEQIMKLDEQSMRIATEGVETVEMGEYADQIKARTKSIEGEITADGKKAETTAAKKKTLDLSAWNNSSLFDDDDFDFDSGTNNGTKIANDLSDKKGDDLHREAAKLCTQQLPTDCRNSASMLQMTYAQRIRSDCTGYENSLKQKKAESAQKLQTAQKAVRDAVLEDVKNKNKYTTEGECVVAFDQCMQTTAKCGADYTGCVADDTVLLMDTTTGDTDKDRAPKVKTAQIKTSASAIGVSANTLAMLTDKAPICESVLKQCENVRKGVWASYLKMIAPTLKSAEVIAEQDRRMNCINNIVECYKKGCAAEWPDEESADYDMCLADPSIVGNICKPQIERCSIAGTGDKVMDYVKAKLASLRVDKCTKEIKECLTSEDRCGENYSGCIGFDTDTIKNLCPSDKLVACREEFSDSDKVESYIERIMTALSLQIDNSLLTSCQNAVDEAIINACGDKTGCPKANISTEAVTDLLRVELCAQVGDEEKCVGDPLALSDDEITQNSYSVKIKGAPEISKISYSSNVATDDSGNSTVTKTPTSMFTATNTDDQTKKIVDMLNNAWKSKVQQIESDPKVSACLNGRVINDNSTASSNLSKVARFENLTQSVRLDIADTLLNRVWEAYNKSLTQLNSKEVPALAKRLSDKRASATANQEENDKKNDEVLESICKAKEAGSQSEPDINGCIHEYKTITAVYNTFTDECSVTTHKFRRYGGGRRGAKKDDDAEGFPQYRNQCNCGAACKFVEDGQRTVTYKKENLLNGTAPIVQITNSSNGTDN